MVSHFSQPGPDPEQTLRLTPDELEESPLLLTYVRQPDLLEQQCKSTDDVRRLLATYGWNTRLGLDDAYSRPGSSRTCFFVLGGTLHSLEISEKPTYVLSEDAIDESPSPENIRKLQSLVRYHTNRGREPLPYMSKRAEQLLRLVQEQPEPTEVFAVEKPRTSFFGAFRRLFGMK